MDRPTPGPMAKSLRNARQRRYRNRVQEALRTSIFDDDAYSFSRLKGAEKVAAIPSPPSNANEYASPRNAFPWECPFCGKIVLGTGGYDRALARAERHVGTHPATVGGKHD